MRALIAALACAAALAAGTPADAAISVALAKKCRAMMVQAYPPMPYGLHGTSYLERDYFSACIRRNGNMDGVEQSAMPDRHPAE